MFKRVMLAALIGLIGTAIGVVGSREFNPIARHFDASVPGASDAPTHRLIVKLHGAGSVAAIGKPTSDPVTALAGRMHFGLRTSRLVVPGLHMMEVTPAVTGEDISVSLARLRADPQVEYAEVDQRRFPHATPNDPLFTGQWYLQNTVSTANGSTLSAVNAQGAWDITTGSASVVIADLDTGIRYDHPDLLALANGGRLLPGYDFVSDVTVANDGDGRDADASDPGDWVTSADAATARFTGCTVENSSWHGTRTAGIMAAIANNGVGISGLTQAGLILPVRVLGKCGGFDSDIMAAMLWAAGIDVAGVPHNTHPARLINMSLGGTPNAADVCPAQYQDVIRQLAARNVLVVASAGNEGGPVDVPANCPGVAGVGGLRHIGTKVGYSNVGTEILVSAPAGNCVNTGAGQPCLFSIDTTVNNGSQSPGVNTYTDQLNYNIGTSFSAPIVTGIAGLMLSVNPNLNVAQLMARLQEGATKPFPIAAPATPAIPQCHVPGSLSDVQGSECSCTTTTCGAGMANALGAVNAALRPIAVIAPPANVTPGQNVTLQAGGSTPANGHTIASYIWTAVCGNPSIQNANTNSATVTVPTSGSLTLRVTVTDDAGRQDTADVLLGDPVGVSITPLATSLVAGTGTQSFVAAVGSACNTAVTWQVNGISGGNAAIGSISATGVYTAPATLPSPANVTVTAVSVADTTKTASASVTITAPPVIAVIVSPPSASLVAGTGTQTFTAIVSNTANTGVTWQVNGIAGGNATVGTITAAGLYTAPATVPTPANVTVTAVSVADTTKSATASVTITGLSPIGVSVAPSSVNLTSNSSQTFAATVTNTTNTAVTWQVNGVVGGNAAVGTISTAGVYTAPAAVPTPANVTVTAVSVADTTKNATATVTVTAPVVTQPPGGGGGGGTLDRMTLLALAGLAALASRRRAAVWARIRAGNALE